MNVQESGVWRNQRRNQSVPLLNRGVDKVGLVHERDGNLFQSRTYQRGRT